VQEEVAPDPLHSPIAVFDAGIGSYGIVQLIHRHYPDQDLLYFADRASFPYGGKTKQALATSIHQAVERLVEMGARAVVLASNAPSVMVLDELRAQLPVPVLGIYPPVSDALATSRSGQVAVLGVASLVQSAEIRAYVARQAGGRGVSLVNASALVQMVEEGTFLSNPQATLDAVRDFVQALRRDWPRIDVCTLSSTHLPWLAPFFAEAAPDMVFLDPAESLIPQLAPYVAPGKGQIRCIATASPSMPLSGLQQMLDLLGVDLQPTLVF